MDISLFDYKLPDELIAQTPSEVRDSSRLLVYNRKTNKIEHCQFYQLPNYLTPGDCIVINKTKVIPAKIYAKKITGGKIELLFLKKIDKTDFTALCRDNILNKLIILPDKSSIAKVVGRTSNGEYILRLQTNTVDIIEIIKKYGQTPLPPYIKRKTIELYDKDRYQTVYAEYEGSIAAPTAGLHFTHNLLEELKSKGVIIAELVLHIGWGTFKPIRDNDITEHYMIEEHYNINATETEKINYSRKIGKKIIAVGTSVTRVLETLADESGFIKSGNGETNLYIYPGYKFKIVNAIITNFHLPKTTPLLLVAAFVDIATIMKLYQEAIELKYRFYSYGDAMFIF